MVLEAIKQDTSTRLLPNHPVFSTVMASGSQGPSRSMSRHQQGLSW